MYKLASTWTSLLMGAVLIGATGTAVAGEEQENEIEQFTEAEQVALNVVANLGVATVGSGGGGIGIPLGSGGPTSEGLAATNCQWLLAVNTVALNVVAVESLGVISDDDESADLDIPAELSGRNGWWQWFPQAETETHTGMSTCDQEIGEVLVRLSGSDGFGAAAPQAASVAEALSGYAYGGGVGGDKENEIHQGVSVAQGSINIVANLGGAVVGGGHGNAAANCQMLTTWNTISANVAAVRNDGAISDDDTDVEVGRELDRALAPSSVENGEEEPSWVISSNETATGEAHCSQSIESLILTTGDDTPRVPPQS